MTGRTPAYLALTATLALCLLTGGCGPHRDLVRLDRGNAADTAIVHRLEMLCQAGDKHLNTRYLTRGREDTAAGTLYYRGAAIPVATAVEDSRHTFNQDNYLSADGVTLHPWFGTYLAACTVYETIFGEQTPAGPQPPHLTSERAALARACAHAACSRPGELTPVPFSPPDADWFTNRNDTGPARSYTLPDALTMADGTRVETPEQWFAARRPELLSLFETEMFGQAPATVPPMRPQTLEEGEAFGGKAVRRQVKLEFPGTGVFLQLLMYLPSGASGSVPVFLGLNFEGNHTVSDDPGILLPLCPGSYGVHGDYPRGSQSGRWPVEDILGRGYALVTLCKDDIDPDYDDGFQNGVTPFIYGEGQDYPEPCQWGSIAAWAWGLSRVLDWLGTVPEADAGRVAVIGHSRLGKTSLWAAAGDTRFAMAVSNSSGCGGAALSRRAYGETVQAITRYFPHWFCGNFFKYARNEDALPFDQHELLALIAPRPLYVASAEDDHWADPEGERLSLEAAREVYDFLGAAPGATGYHMRRGDHELTREDWSHYLDFADRHLK